MCPDGSLVGGRKSREALPGKEPAWLKAGKQKKHWESSEVGLAGSGKGSLHSEGAAVTDTSSLCYGGSPFISKVSFILLVARPEGISSLIPISCPGH